MTPGRIVALVTGCVVALAGLGMAVVGGVLLALTGAPGQDGFATSTVSLTSTRAAVTSDDVTFHLDRATPDWLTDVFRTDVRVRVVSSDPDVFVGVGRADDVDAWLDGAAVGHVTGLAGSDVEVSEVDGSVTVAPPADQAFWVAATTTTSEAFDWTVTDGTWTVVAATVDGQPGLDAVLDVGVRSAFLRPVAIGLAVTGGLLGMTALGLVVAAARGHGGSDHGDDSQDPTPPPGQPVRAEEQVQAAAPR